jgi:hypothetical protein
MIHFLTRTLLGLILFGLAWLVALLGLLALAWWAFKDPIPEPPAAEPDLDRVARWAPQGQWTPADDRLYKKACQEKKEN